MADLRIHKVADQLPTTLEPNAIYLVKTGTGVDLVVTGSATSPVVPFKLNLDELVKSFGAPDTDFVTLFETGLLPNVEDVPTTNSSLPIGLSRGLSSLSQSYPV